MKNYIKNFPYIPIAVFILILCFLYVIFKRKKITESGYTITDHKKLCTGLSPDDTARCLDRHRKQDA